MAKLINCKTCGTQMASNVKKCPSCGTKNKKPVYKKWWVYVLIVIVIAAMVLGGCSGDGENREITDAEGADKISTTIEEQMLFAANDVKITAKEYTDDSIWGEGIKLLIENNSGENIVVQCDDVSINGFMITPLFSCEVYNEKKAVDTIDFFSSELKENGIETIEKIELKFKIINADT